ncbi:MAG: Free methionine-R-sulfoxide reductase [Candidatus Izimaplasma bacterium HR2]|nr:MAG: Free methionine-R-sulfoxide reductase [Candidatus Izimaplasma bacterium HR2]
MFVNIEKSLDKTENYEILLSNLDYYIIKGDNLITNLSNLSAYLNYFLDDINWVGFYLYDGDKLYLGPFQGLPACTLIALGNGVCGTSASTKETIVVKDVHQFENHIGCDSASNSEIVIPIIKNNELIGVLDIDSPSFSRFNKIDKLYLEKVISKLVDKL